MKEEKNRSRTQRSQRGQATRNWVVACLLLCCPACCYQKKRNPKQNTAHISKSQASTRNRIVRRLFLALEHLDSRCVRMCVCVCARVCQCVCVCVCQCVFSASCLLQLLLNHVPQTYIAYLPRYWVSAPNKQVVRKSPPPTWTQRALVDRRPHLSNVPHAASTEDPNAYETKSYRILFDCRRTHGVLG